MAKHWSKYLHERIAQNERTIKSLSSVAREAEKNLSAMRDKFKSEQLRREQSERALYDAKPKLIRLNLENQQLRAQFIEQTKLQDALAEANNKIKKLEKELNRRSGLENPYGLATPSSKRVTKTNSTLENRAKHGGAGFGHKGYGRKKIMAICKSQANHPGIQHIQNIFRAHPTRLFQWLKSPEIPADNNFAERNLRPTVIARKISFGSHSKKGLETREILMTIMHTAKCRGRDPAEFLEEILDILAQDKSADISHMLIPKIPAKKSRAA